MVVNKFLLNLAIRSNLLKSLPASLYQREEKCFPSFLKGG
jgi:hypothetical protein